jgi:hypothetical protein
MSPLQPTEVESILHRVQTWPIPVQLSLATRILQSLEVSSARPSQSVKKLLGLLTVNGAPPSDEECENIIAEERLRKYS